MEKQKKSPLKSYAKYSSIALQMLVIIVLGAFGGVKLDEYLDLQFPVFTLLFTVIAVVLAIYYSVKDFIKNK